MLMWSFGSLKEVWGHGERSFDGRSAHSDAQGLSIGPVIRDVCVYNIVYPYIYTHIVYPYIYTYCISIYIYIYTYMYIYRG